MRWRLASKAWIFPPLRRAGRRARWAATRSSLCPTKRSTYSAPCAGASAKPSGRFSPTSRPALRPGKRRSTPKRGHRFRAAISAGPPAPGSSSPSRTPGRCAPNIFTSTSRPRPIAFRLRPLTGSSSRISTRSASASTGSSAPGHRRAGPPPSFPDAEGWSIHGQSTFIYQGYPAFRSPYAGAKSLPGGGEGRETFSNSAILGRRLWEGAEVYFNPELLQGFGLGGTNGLAGFSNGEAQKSNFPLPRPNVSRLFLRQAFGLGGKKESFDDAPFSLATERDVSRVTVTAGKFSVVDFFDNNAYSHDPRTDFFNWAIWNSGAFDLCGRHARAHLRRGRRTQSGGLGVAGRLFRRAARAQRQQFRRPHP